MIAKNVVWPLSSGPGRDEHRAAEGAQEDRRPADVERLVGQADEVALRAEGLDPGVLGAAEIEQVVGSRVLRRDRVEHAADEAAVVGGRGSSGRATSATGRGESDHLAADGRELPSAAARIRSGVSASERIVWRIFRANSSRPRRPSPSLAGRTTSARCATEPSERRAGDRRCGGESRPQLGDGRVVGRRRLPPGPPR